MKADEVIEILKTWRIAGDKAHEALDMAIEALAKDINVPINDCISRKAAIDALIEGFKRSPTVAIRAKDMIEQLPSAQPEPSDVARDIATIIENEKDMRVVLRNSEQTTLYEYDVQHLVIIANILERENLSPETVGEILRDASRIYTIVRDEAVKDFNEAVRNCMENAVKTDG